MWKNTFDRKLKLSYFILVILMVCMVASGTYFAFRRTYMNAVEESNRRLLEATVALYDEQIFKPLGKVYAELLISSGVSSVVNRFYNGIAMEPMEVYAVSKYLRTSAISNEMIHSIHLCAPGNKAILSTRYGYKTGEEAEEMIRQLCFEGKSVTGQEYPIMSPPFSYPDEPGQFYYHVIYPSDYGPDKKQSDKGFILFTMDCARIGKLINGMEDNDIYIVDSDGIVICGAEEMTSGTQADFVFDPEQDYSWSVGKGVVISCMRTSVREHFFMAKASTGSFYPAAGLLILEIIGIAALIAVVGMGLAALLSRQMTKPVREIILSVNHVLPEEKKYQKRDLEGIVKTICEEFHSLEQFTKSSKESLKNHFLMSLYLDKGMESDTADKLKYIGFRTDRGVYRALLLHIRVPAQAGIEASQMASYKYVHDIQSKAESAVASEVESHMIAVLCGEEDREAILSCIRENQEGFPVCICEGRALTTYRAAGSSLTSMKKMTEYEFFYPEKYFWTESELQEYSGSLPEELSLREFSKQLKNVDTEYCRRFLEELLQDMDRSRIAAEERQRVLLQVVSCVSNVVREMNYRLDSLQTVIEAEDIAEFSQLFDRLLEEYKKIVFSGQQSRKAEEIGAIKEFIGRNYDKDISLGMIADSVHMHPAYVSRFFKEQTGQNITEYIRDIKLAEAEKIIVSTNESIEKIAGKLGYNTTHYFIRQFREKYGETPAAYRKNQGK